MCCTEAQHILYSKLKLRFGAALSSRNIATNNTFSMLKALPNYFNPAFEPIQIHSKILCRYINVQYIDVDIEEL